MHWFLSTRSPYSQTPLTCPPAAESRIKELADLVKVLRRALKESQGRANDFIAAATRFEKEVGQQVEGVRLAAESDKRATQVSPPTRTLRTAAAPAAHMRLACGCPDAVPQHTAPAVGYIHCVRALSPSCCH